MEMSKTRMLFIRACKSKDPAKRLKSVYRRTYLADSNADFHIANILLSIVKDYDLATLDKFLAAMSPDNDWMYADNNAKEPLPYWTKVKLVCTTVIRFTEAKKCEGMIWPAWSRRYSKPGTGQFGGCPSLE